jgi:hypothetical protein
MKAMFEDRSSATRTTLVGSDGYRSIIRDLLLGEEKGTVSPIPGGIQLVSGTCIRYNDAEKARHVRQLPSDQSGGFHPDFPIRT